MQSGGGTALTVKAADNTITPTYASGTATAESGKVGNATITINLPKTQDQNSNTSAADDTTYTYKVYKVFDAVPASTTSSTDTVSYTVMDGKKNSAGTTNAEKAGFTDTNGMATYFTADSAYNVTATDSATDSDGKLTADAAAAIAKYVSGDDAYAAVKVDAKHDGTATTSLQITGLPYGYYYITTTTGSVVTVDTTHPNAKVDDKNSVPTVDKKITEVKESSTSTSNTNAGSVSSDGKKSIAQAGSVVTFQSTITVGKGAVGYVFKDKLDDNLKLITTGENAITVAYKTSTESDATNLTATSDYTLDTTVGGTGDDAYTFQITLGTSDAAKTALTQGNQIVITYKATVNSNALQTAPGKNKAWVEYGNDPKSKTVPSETETYNGKIEVTKNFDGVTGTTDTLADGDSAQFVLKKGNQFYKVRNLTEIKSGTTVDVGAAVSWVNSESDATKLTFTKTGEKLTFVGLSDGTYTLTENKVPKGYNKAVDETFTINAATSAKSNTFKGTNANNDNLYKSTTIANKKGSLLPSTGGIGTTIFYVAGGILIIGAAVLLINRKKATND